MIKRIVYVIVAPILLVLGMFLLRSDYLSFMQWWAIIAFIGIIFMPLSILLFQNFTDRGYLFSKVIGIAITGYLMWVLSSVHLMKFTRMSCVLTLLLCAMINGGILFFLWKKQKNYVREGMNKLIEKDGILDQIIFDEILFFAVFLLFTYIRGFKPEAYGTEKFMDYGFMTSMMRSEYMPPQDFWFSGTKLNYYYVGQFLATFLTKLSGVEVKVGYNIMLMMVGAFAFVLPYSLVYTILKQYGREREKKIKVLPVISALIAGSGVCIAGNMHYPTYKWFEGWVRKFFGMEASTAKYWFPDATRFIGYHPETTDKTIHEFPSYSFVLGDLHAHVINIMFVLTVLAILFAWMIKRRQVAKVKLPLFTEVFNPNIILVSFFIGLFHTTNYWDFPIYFVVSGGVILFTNLVVYNFKWVAWGVTAVQGIFVLCFSELICLPFTLNFDQISSTPLLTVARTPLNQLIILWGLPIFTVISFICFVIADFTKHHKKNSIQDMTQEYTEQITQEHMKEVTKAKKPALLHFMAALSSIDLFIITLGLCAIGLIMLPEVIYIKDIYSGDYKRANTMFKLTYQAFIMFGICFGYIPMRLLCFGKTLRQRKVAIIVLCLFSLTLCYGQNAVKSWYGNIFNTKGYKGLDATAFMQSNSAFLDDVGAIKWLNDNVTEVQVVLEANGDSYTDYERVSVMTGLPTVLGWRTHEWLWKSDTIKLDERAADIEEIYTSTDRSKVLSLIKKYSIAYIYVGKLEQDKFTDINHEMLNSMGVKVYNSPATEQKTYETYIIKVKN